MLPQIALIGKQNIIYLSHLIVGVEFNAYLVDKVLPLLDLIGCSLFSFVSFELGDKAFRRVFPMCL